MSEERVVQEFVISDALWEKIAPLLPKHEAKVHPLGCHRPRIADRQVLNGIFFVLRIGCPGTLWVGKALDATGICKGSTAHSRFQEWQADGFFARLWEAALRDYDAQKGLNWEWLALNGALHTAPLGAGKSGSNPCDRSKRGVKTSLLTEARGIPVGVAIEGTNRHDMKLTQATLESVPPQVQARRRLHLAMVQDNGLGAQGGEQGLCMDAGYDYQEVRAIARSFGYTAHIRRRGEEKKARVAGHKARRWVVERTHSWLHRYRRLLIRWGKKPGNYLALLHLACAFIAWNQCLFG